MIMSALLLFLSSFGVLCDTVTGALRASHNVTRNNSVVDNDDGRPSYTNVSGITKRPVDI